MNIYEIPPYIRRATLMEIVDDVAAKVRTFRQLRARGIQEVQFVIGDRGRGRVAFLSEAAVRSYFARPYLDALDVLIDAQLPEAKP